MVDGHEGQWHLHGRHLHPNRCRSLDRDGFLKDISSRSEQYTYPMCLFGPGTSNNRKRRSHSWEVNWNTWTVLVEATPRHRHVVALFPLRDQYGNNDDENATPGQFTCLILSHICTAYLVQFLTQSSPSRFHVNDILPESASARQGRCCLGARKSENAGKQISRTVPFEPRQDAFVIH